MNDRQRLRWAKTHELELRLSREQYLELARLPFWAAYGPEHGLPAELFNENGLLLPKYRPGGGLYERFRGWRRWHRHVSWRQRALNRRIERINGAHGGVIRVGLLTAVYLVALAVAPRLHGRAPRVPENVLVLALVLLQILVAAVLMIILYLIPAHCVARPALRTFPPPEGGG